MEQEIKALNVRVDKMMMRMNITILIGLIGLILTLYKIFSSAQYPHAPQPTNTNSVQIGGASKEKPQREFLSSEEVGQVPRAVKRVVWCRQHLTVPAAIASTRTGAREIID